MDLDRALLLLRNDEVVGVPTDTVYGIGADPVSKLGVDKLFSIKGRGVGKPIGLLVATIDQALEVVDLPRYAQDWARQHWPGPLNLIGRPLIEVRVGGFDSLAVRVPDHETALRLLAGFGPLAVTSANRTDGPETLTDDEAQVVLGDDVAYYIPGSSPGGIASTTIDVRGDEPVLLREGPLRLF